MHNASRFLAAATFAGALLLAPACGDDSADPSDSTSAADTTDSGATGTTDADMAFPSGEFCDAVADFEAAQDGAQRTQALGDMAAALGEDAPSDVSRAIQDLDTGDLPAEVYAEAGEILSDACA